MTSAVNPAVPQHREHPAELGHQPQPSTQGAEPGPSCARERAAVLPSGAAVASVRPAGRGRAGVSPPQKSTPAVRGTRLVLRPAISCHSPAACCGRHPGDTLRIVTLNACQGAGLSGPPRPHTCPAFSTLFKGPSAPTGQAPPSRREPARAAGQILRPRSATPQPTSVKVSAKASAPCHKALLFTALCVLARSVPSPVSPPKCCSHDFCPGPPSGRQAAAPASPAASPRRLWGSASPAGFSLPASYPAHAARDLRTWPLLSFEATSPAPANGCSRITEDLRKCPTTPTTPSWLHLFSFAQRVVPPLSMGNATATCPALQSCPAL